MSENTWLMGERTRRFASTVSILCTKTNGRNLLGRRALSSTYPGLWCIPCGYVEYDEDVRRAAIREFHEETGLIIELDGEAHTVGIWFTARVVAGKLHPGYDIDAVNYFSLTEVPLLAFPTNKQIISLLLETSK